MPLGTEVGLSAGNTVLDEDSVPPPRKGAQSAPYFSAHAYCDQTVTVSATAELLFSFLQRKRQNNVL